MSLRAAITLSLVLTPIALSQPADIVNQSMNEVFEQYLSQPFTTKPISFDGSFERQQFLVIEGIARLPDAEQIEQLPDFYSQLAPRYMNPFVTMILSSYRKDILDPKAIGFPDHPYHKVWVEQLTRAESTFTPEQVADKIGSDLWLKVVARARSIQILARHRSHTLNLIDADLASKNPQRIDRACLTIGALALNSYFPRLLSMHLTEAKATPIDPNKNPLINRTSVMKDYLIIS